MEKSDRKFHYEWVIITLCFLMIFTCLGFCSSNNSLYVQAITRANGFPRSLFGFKESFRFISTAVVNVFFGALIKRFGAKKLIIAGFLCHISAMLTYSFATELFHFYIGATLLGVGMALTTTGMVGLVVRKWVRKNQGTVMGAVLAANGLGGAVAAPLVTPFIDDPSNAFGYRNAYLLVAAILGVLMLLMILFFRNEPKEKAAAPAMKKKKRGGDWVGVTFKEVLRKPYFYVAIVLTFFTGLILQSINGIAITHMKDVGMSPEFTAMIAGIASLALAGFKFLTGLIYDRTGLRVTMTICYCAEILLMGALFFIALTPMGYVSAFAYTILSSMALPLETVMLPILTGELFGQKDYPKLLGIVIAANTAGYALGAPLTGLSFDVFGNYKPVFIIGAVLSAAILIIVQFNLSSASKLRSEVESRQSEMGRP